MDDPSPQPLKTAGEMLDLIASRVGYMLDNPRGYADTANELDGLLHTFVRIWAEGAGREDAFWHALEAELEREGYGVMAFGRAYRRDHPSAAEAEITAFVIACWRNINAATGIPPLQVE